MLKQVLRVLLVLVLVVMFGVFQSPDFVTFSYAADPVAPPARTGQTSCWNALGALLPSCSDTKQTGDTLAGVAWPTPRFVPNANGTVTDNLTGLVWLKNVNCFGIVPWATAIAFVNGLASGVCGLTDGSTVGQWRLPNVLELRSLINEQEPNVANWLNLQGFDGVRSGEYWSSSSYAYDTSISWVVYMTAGYVTLNGSKTASSNYVWPVRGGQ